MSERNPSRFRTRAAEAGKKLNHTIATKQNFFKAATFGILSADVIEVFGGTRTDSVIIGTLISSAMYASLKVIDIFDRNN